MHSGSRPPDPPASPGASSASSVSGSTSTLHETPRQQGATYGASYTVTSITPSDERLQGAPEAHEGPKWSGFVALDSEPRPTKSVGVTLTAHTASGTLYAIASGPSSPPMSPRTPETPIFGSTSQRHRRVVLNGQGNGDTPSRLDGNAQETRMPTDSFGTLRVNIDPIAATPSNGNTREQSLEAADGEKMQAAAMPFKETSLGAVITTVNTYKQKQSYEDITEASMSDTVDQIERAFGFKTPDMVANGTGSLERTGSKRLKNGNRSPSNSMQDIQLTRRAQSGESLNRTRSSDDEESPANILKRLSKEANREHDRVLQRKSEGDLPQNVIKSKTATVMEASPTSVEVKKEAVRKSEFEARMAARNLLIERLENHRQSLEGDSVEGIKIYHAKSRSTPVDGGRTVNGEKPARPRQSSHDEIARMSSERDGGEAVKMAHHSRRKKSSESPHVKVRTPDSSRTAKPVVRSERKIRLTSSTSSGSHPVDKSQTVPRQRSSRRQRHVPKQLVAAAGGNSDSSDEQSKVRLTRGGDCVDATPTVAGKLHYTPERNKKSSSLPRELEAGTSPRAGDTREIRSHRSHSHSHSSHLKGARITKIKMSASEEPNDSIVDQTSRLLHAAKGVKYDKGSSLVIAEDVLHSLTRASDLLHHQSSAAREERDRKDKDKDKDKSLSRIKAPGKCSGDGKGWRREGRGENKKRRVGGEKALEMAASVRGLSRTRTLMVFAVPQFL